MPSRQFHDTEAERVARIQDVKITEVFQIGSVSSDHSTLLHIQSFPDNGVTQCFYDSWRIEAAQLYGVVHFHQACLFLFFCFYSGYCWRFSTFGSAV